MLPVYKYQACKMKFLKNIFISIATKYDKTLTNLCEY